jgi:hypothetical protein
MYLYNFRIKKENMFQETGFPILKNDDILNCFAQMKIQGFKKNIENVSPFAFKEILRKFLEFFAGKAFLEIYQPKLSAIEYLTYPELHEESTLFITEYRYLSEIISKSSMENLFIFDFIKSNPEKVKKIFSGIINFARFKEKEITALKKFYEINQKIFSSSFEIFSGLKFYKKKVLFLSNNYKKKNLNERYEKKRKKLFFFFFWQFFLLKSKKSKKYYSSILTYIIRIKSHYNLYILFRNNFYSSSSKKNLFSHDHLKILEKSKRYDIKICETIKILMRFSGFFFSKIVQAKSVFREIQCIDSEIISIINFFARYHEFQSTFFLLESFFRKIKNLPLINLCRVTNQKKTFTRKKIFFNKIRNYKYKNPYPLSKFTKRNKKFRTNCEILKKKEFKMNIFKLSFLILGIIPYIS